MQQRDSVARTKAAASRRLALYTGFGVLALGVLLDARMFLDAASDHYMLAGMAIHRSMVLAMGLVFASLLSAAFGLIPSETREGAAASPPATSYSPLTAMDNVRLSSIHWKLVAALLAALVIDTIKPATLAFVLPGMAKEYGLTKAALAVLPFFALIGTTVGSFFAGWIADRGGRRASLLLGALVFVATATCATMPSFALNVLMCFIMGLAAGGMLPVTTALLSEVLPARRRALLLVCLAGLGAAGGYLAASASATWLEPQYGWRILWLLGAPTGFILLLVSRYIPESPRFLLSQGRVQEANVALRAFSVHVPDGGSLVQSDVVASDSGRNRIVSLFARSHASQTTAVALYGLTTGLVNYGFLLWLPSNLRAAGFSAGASNALLARSALVALPGVLLVARLYSRWSSKKSLVLLSGLTALTLLAFIPSTTISGHNTLLLSVLLASTTGITTVLAAACGKAGGVIGRGAVLLRLMPALALSGSVVAGAAVVSALVLVSKGVETRGRSLEEIRTAHVPREI